MEDFNSRFKEEFEKQELPSFRASSWEKMAKKLDFSSNKNTGFAFLRYWWLIPLVMLLLWNFRLQHQVDQMLAGTDIVTTDTIYLEKVTMHRDTIVQVRTEYVYSPPTIMEVETSAFNQPGRFESAPGFRSTMSNYTGAKTTGEQAHHLSPFQLSTTDQSISQPSDWITQNIGSPYWLKPVLTEEDSQVRSSLSSYIDHESLLKKAKRHDFADHFIPRGLSIYGGAGVVQSLSTPLENRFSTEQFVGIDLHFINSFQLWIEWTRQSLQFKSHGMGQAFGIPEVTPPSDEFEFEEAQVDLEARQYTAGLGYLFNRSHRLRYSLGIGVSAVEYRPTDILYDFVKKGSGEEWILEGNSSSTPISFNYLNIRGGLRYGITRTWDVGLAVSYRLSMDSEIRNNDHQIGLRLSLHARIF